jgi:2-oxoglutarate ferredoxin oxidoreductase subunit alpha
VAQGDIMQARWGTHGDHPIIALYPSSAQEAFELTVKAFNLAERFRIPVLLLSDAIVAGLREKVELPDPADIEIFERPEPAVSPQQYKPFDYSSSAVPPLAKFGSGYRFHVTGLLHDEMGAPTEDSALVSQWWDYMNRKLQDHLDEILDYDEVELEDAETVIIAYGCTARAAAHAVTLAREEGLRVGLLKLKTIWPFADPVIDALANRTERFIVPELNLGQIRSEVERVVAGRASITGINRADGRQITPDEILETLRAQVPVA